jgi:branched-chain amino acid transport system permease protein
MPIALGFPLTLAVCASIGVLTEFVAVRPVMAGLEKHLYVLSTLALALMMQQLAAIEWSTEPQPFPRIVDGGLARDEKFWLPLAACAVVILGLELLYRRTLVGRAFVAIAEDNDAARALGLPERRLRITRFRLVGAIAGLRASPADGRCRLDRERADAKLLWLRSVALVVRQQSRGDCRRPTARRLSAGAIQVVSGLVSVAVFAAFTVVLMAAPQGLFGASPVRRV